MKSNLFLVSHSPLLATGYGRVTAALSSALVAAGHDVTILGLGYTGESHARACRILPWTSTLPEIAHAITAECPTLLITIGDPWMFEDLPELTERNRVKWLAYFPVDGHPLPLAWKTWIAAADLPIVFCEFTRKVIEESTGISPRVIHHGVDTKTFAPRDKAWAKGRVGVDGKFVVGCVAANQQRKNLPALIKAFAHFAADKDDVILYLHTPIAGHWDIQELVARFGVEGKTRATLNLDPQRGVSDEILATIYNAFDVFVLPTMAEGFGLPIIESQACGVPALVTDFSACSELVPDPFQRLRVKETLIMARNFEQAIVDEAEIAGKCDRLYNDRDERRRLGEQCLAFARGFDWSRVCREFVDAVGAL
jgi:glycosyltransferase involved in cell wall biosynthesis